MLKSTKLVLCLGTLLGASVAVLPSTSFAATSITSKDAVVSATVNGVIGFTASPVAGDGYSYDSTNGYSGTFNLMDSTENIGTTTYTVLCNYTSDFKGNVKEEKPEGSGTFENVVGTVDGVANTTFVNGNTTCANGWYVSAKSKYNDGNGTAVMATVAPASDEGTPTSGFTISSTAPTDASAPFSGTNANWGMKVVPVSKTFSGTDYIPSALNSFGSFHAIPASESNVVSGNTFRTISGTPTYIGTESFKVQYGLTAGMNAVAGTYTGKIVYTLYLGAI